MKKLFISTNELDNKAVAKFDLTDELLMENAAAALAAKVREKIKKGSKILAVCGGGNNGADGIAALRILSGEYTCELFLTSQNLSVLANIQLKRALNLGVKMVSEIGEYDCIIDAIFGSGLNRNLDEKTINLIQALNLKSGYKIACDIPTGIGKMGEDLGFGVAFKANTTITMGARKLALYSDFAKDFVGKIKVANLGLSEVKFEGETKFFKLQKSDLKLPFRDKQNVNKGDFGHAFIVSGQKHGASQMAANAALAMGAGLISVVGEPNLTTDYQIMQSENISQNMRYGAVGMGLGALNEAQKVELFRELSAKDGLVLDADLCYEPLTIELLKSKKEIVITPHPKEFASLLNLAQIGEFSVAEVQNRRFELALKWSETFNSVLVLKGANTIIAKGGEIYVMPYGSPILAKGGSGDVLAGIILALLSQGFEPLKAAISGTLAHALSVRNLKINSYAVTAKDIIKGLRWLQKK